MIIVDAEMDGGYYFEGLKKLKHNLENEMGFDLQLNDSTLSVEKFKNRRKPQAAFSGWIKNLKKTDGESRDIDFVYLKLSFDQDLYDDIKDSIGSEHQCSESLSTIRSNMNKKIKPNVPCSVVDYIRQGDKVKTRFPQNSTADIFYSKEQFWAYRDLGYYLAVTELEPELKRLGWLEALGKSDNPRKDYFDKLVNNTDMVR